MQKFDLTLSGGQVVKMTTDELIITDEQAQDAALSIALHAAQFSGTDWHICRLNIGGQGDVFAFYRHQGRAVEIDLCPEGSDLFSDRLYQAIPNL